MAYNEAGIAEFAPDDQAFDDRAVLAITRIRFKHAWMMFIAVRKFRRLYSRSSLYPGFIRGEVGIADPWTLVNVSLWRNQSTMFQWTGNIEHVHGIRWTYQRATEVWSSYAVLQKVSRSAHRWSGKVMIAAHDQSPGQGFENTPSRTRSNSSSSPRG